MGRFPGGNAAVRKSRTEIAVRIPAPASVAIMKTARHQDGEIFDIAHADIRRSTAVGKRAISSRTDTAGEQIAGLRVKFTRMVPMLDFRNPFFHTYQSKWNRIRLFLHRKN